MKTHGFTNHPLYRVWHGMKCRCVGLLPHHETRYKNRGITVCDMWINDPAAFINWALSNGYKPGLQIDRIKNHKGYSPDNCRFVTAAVNIENRDLIQSNNTSGYRGVSYCNRDDKWVAFYSNKRLGRFPSRIDAAVFRDSYVISNGLGAPLNFPVNHTI